MNAQQIALSLVLATMVFSIALELQLSDFKRIALAPKPVIAGLIPQFVLLPVGTWLATLALGPNMAPGPVHDAAEHLWEQQFEGWLHSFEDYLTDNARTRGMYAAYRGLNQATCRLWLNGEIGKDDARQILMKAQEALITEVGPLLAEGAGTHPATATP